MSLRTLRRPGRTAHRTSGVDAGDAVAAPRPVAVTALPPTGAAADDRAVPRPFRVAAAWSWRILVIGVAVYALLQVLGPIRLVVYSLVIALLLSALLYPAANLLRRVMPRALAAAVVFIGGIAAVIGILTALGFTLANELPEITASAAEGFEQVRTWLQEGPFALGDERIEDYLTQAQTWAAENASNLTTGAVGAAGTVGQFTAGLVLALFATFFFLYDGKRIWSWVVRLFPRDVEADVDSAGCAAWATLEGYVRSVVVIAAIDALGIGILLVVLGVPLAVPLAILVFFGAFVPLVGAFITGGVAVLVGLVTQGPFVALAVLGGIIVVQQVEGNLLQPLIMSRLVYIHPLAVAVTISAGALLAGIIGAIISVPLVAVVNTVVTHLLRRADGRRTPSPLPASP